MDSYLPEPDFPGSQYPRGPTDKNSAMFPFERRMADAIESRCGGRATSPQHNMADLTSDKPSVSPGKPS